MGDINILATVDNSYERASNDNSNSSGLDCGMFTDDNFLESINLSFIPSTQENEQKSNNVSCEIDSLVSTTALDNGMFSTGKKEIITI